jgi:putative ABC transport system substrate-binding protein
MDRRRLVISMAACAASRLVSAQPAGRTYRIGYLGYTATDSSEGAQRIWNAFVQRLHDLGFAEGGNLVIEQRFAEGQVERYPTLAAELIGLKVDVFVVASGSAARAVMSASRSMPIVTVAVPDPVRAGLVASLAHPGGQVTGISNLADELVPKRLELLKAAVPQATRIAIARCPRCTQSSGQRAAEALAMYQEQAAAAHALGVALLPLEVNSASDFESAKAAVARERPEALLIGATPVNVALRKEWVALADAQRLPMLAPYRGFGAMLSYGPDFEAILRRAAEYVARILNGAKPAELPMEQPTKLEFVVDLRIARSIGLESPQSVLLRADEVIR